jgi:uncharacterized repeat protein (TIGR02543 family)
VDALPDPPAREGYDFTDWNTDPDGSGDAFTAETTVSGDIMVYAQWKSFPKFVAVARNSDHAAWSADGINWMTSTLPSSASWYSVTHGNGKFIAVNNTNDKAAWSANGVNWTLVTMPSKDLWRSVTYGGE